jgi:hypothetical protein
MTLEESEAEADRILSEAGWTTTLKPPWKGRHVAPGLVGGRAPDGNAYAKAYSAFAQSEAVAMGLDPALYPDEPHEAAAVLVASIAAPVASAPEPEQIPQDETVRSDDRDSDAAAPVWPGDYAPEDASGAEIVLGEHVAECPEHDDGGDAAAAVGVVEGSAASVQQPGDAIDADYLETNQLDDYSLGAEIEDAESEASGAFIFGDNLDQKRTAAIGLVVQISLAKQEAIWAEAGAHPDEFGALTSAVVRDTIDGSYRGPQATYDRFVLLSQHNNAAGRVKAVESERVKLLATATREQIEAFDPEADWP